MSGLKLKPLIVGIGLVVAGVWVAMTELQTLRAYQLQESARTATVEANVYNASKAIAQSSGKILHYDVSFDFLADSDQGSKTSIAAKSAQVSKMLQNQFLGGGNPAANAPKPQLALPEAPIGKSYFAGKQQLRTEEYNKISMGGARVNYDPSDPKNCALTIANGPSTSKLYVLAPFFTVLGGLLTWVGLAGVLRRSPAPVQDETQLSELAR